MSKVAQIYKIEINDSPENVKPAQFVLADDDDSAAVGFVMDTDGVTMTVVLWEPTILPDDVTVISEAAEPEELIAMLYFAIQKNPMMMSSWEQFFENMGVSLNDMVDIDAPLA